MGTHFWCPWLSSAAKHQKHIHWGTFLMFAGSHPLPLHSDTLSTSHCCHRPTDSPMLQWTTTPATMEEWAGVHGMSANFHFLSIYILTTTQPVPLHGKRANAPPLASHSSPNPSTTTQTLECAHKGTF